MDYIFGALLALSATCAVLAGASIRSAREAKGQAASAHRLAVQLQSRDSVEVMPDGRVRFFAMRAGCIQEVVLGNKPAPEVRVTPGNLYVTGGSVTIESSAANRDLLDLYQRIKDLQDKSPRRGD